MVHIKYMFYEFLLNGWERNEPHLSGDLLGSKIRNWWFAQVEVEAKIEKKARRDHKSCDKKTETRFKITSFLTENIWFTGIVQFHAFYQSCLYPWTDYPIEAWFEIVSRDPRTSGFGNTLTKWFKSNGGFNLSLNMFSKD